MTVIAIFFALLALVAALATLAKQLNLPYPILLVLGNQDWPLCRAYPRLPSSPKFVFFLFLPPLLFGAAYTTL